MYKLLRYLFVSVVAVMAIAVSPYCEAEKITVAVIPFENATAKEEKYVNIESSEAVTEGIVSALYDSGRFVVVERDRMNVVLQEVGFQTSGVVDSNKAVEVGKMLGVQYLVIGKVTVAKTMRNDLSFRGRFSASIALNYRIVDIQTGEIKFVGNAKSVGFANENRDAALYDAGKKVGIKALKNIQLDVTANVAEIHENMIYIDVGTGGGFLKGDKLVILRETTPLEINGKIVGMKEINVGTAKVTEVHEGYSICEVTKSSTEIKKGDIVKI